KSARHGLALSGFRMAVVQGSLLGSRWLDTTGSLAGRGRILGLLPYGQGENPAGKTPVSLGAFELLPHPLPSAPFLPWQIPPTSFPAASRSPVPSVSPTT